MKKELDNSKRLCVFLLKKHNQSYTIRHLIAWFLPALLLWAAQATAQSHTQTDGLILPTQSAKFIKLNQTNYVYRWSKSNQYEYTPTTQPDLQKWQDMLTIVYYPEVKDGEGLARTANGLLETYKKHAAQVLKTTSKPRTTTEAAEHFIAVVFARKKIVEFVQVRLKINHGVGVAVVHSHRTYGKKAVALAQKWIQANGAKLDAQLMALKGIPTLPDLQNLTKKQ